MMRFSGEVVSDVEIEVSQFGNGKIDGKFVMQEIINEADMDMNGLIDYTEFFTLMSPKRA